MEIRDVIHGAIGIKNEEIAVIDHPFFQRLRDIRAVGFADNSFPTATHNRYTHSLGALETVTRVFKHLCSPAQKTSSRRLELESVPIARRDRLTLDELSSEAKTRYIRVVRLAALLHDIGHGPLSHTSECAMPDVKHLELSPDHFSTQYLDSLKSDPKGRKATHEDYTLKIILESDLTIALEKAGKPFGIKPIHIAALISKDVDPKDDFFCETLPGIASTGPAGEGTNEGFGNRIDFRPLFQQLISSEVDCDRMDYLRRDSFYTGVSYGIFDFDWLATNLTFHIRSKKAFLAIEHRALYTFEDFLLSRFHMFMMVYFHYKSVVYDEMLKKYFESEDCNYVLPHSMTDYLKCTDLDLFSHLNRQSKNEWASRIVEKRPYRLLLEIQTGIPASRASATEQFELFEKVQAELAEKKIPSLVSTSTSELSKYFGKSQEYPIFVRYDNHLTNAQFIPLEKCTDLFERYREKRSIVRLYAG